MGYIERGAVKEKLSPMLNDPEAIDFWEWQCSEIDDIPDADVRPVVRGEWKEWWPGDCALIMTGEEMLWACSECGSKYSEKQNYCPNCGAMMEES